MLLSVLGISLNSNLSKHIKGNTGYCHHCDIKGNYFLYLFLETVFEGFSMVTMEPLSYGSWDGKQSVCSNNFTPWLNFLGYFQHRFLCRNGNCSKIFFFILLLSAWQRVQVTLRILFLVFCIGEELLTSLKNGNKFCYGYCSDLQADCGLCSWRNCFDSELVPEEKLYVK